MWAMGTALNLLKKLSRLLYSEHKKQTIKRLSALLITGASIRTNVKSMQPININPIFFPLEIKNMEIPIAKVIKVNMLAINLSSMTINFFEK